jgi:hypothetical protein
MRLSTALDLDGYTQFSLYGIVNNLILNSPTTKGILKVWHAARNESTDYKELTASSTDFTTDGNEYAYVEQFSRFVIITFEWDDSAGGSCDLEVLVVPKR